MKYTEKCPDFQRAVRPLATGALVLIASMTSIAQEANWPLASQVSERFVGVTATFERFERYYDPFQSVALYGADRRSSGTIIGRLTWGERGLLRGWQADGEWYPVVGEASYAYIGYAAGFNAPFPRHRGGAEYFRTFPGSVEGSVGFRGYVFRDNRTVMLATGTAGVYVGNAWISLRPYVSINLPRPSLSMVLTGRYYLGERDEFLFLRTGVGLTPDERSTFTASGGPTTDVFTLHSQSLGGGGQWFVASGWLATLEGTIARQEVGFRRGTYVWNPMLLIGVRAAVR